ncbi:hypothetical protein [Burkholderia pseudomallei]|uniref:hypothetical protein n=1 Tax=Burkholderia pseudomallei TaxID=28450 RepID=UPI000A5DDCA2|nr:hypothetical protein [Burkholderia pseudomallei]
MAMEMSNEKACLLILSLICDFVFDGDQPLAHDDLARIIRDVAELRGHREEWQT